MKDRRIEFIVSDCRGREFDDTLIYYGCKEFEKVDPLKFRNHLYKARRADGKIPRNGRYCLAGELAEELYNIDGDGSHVTGLNKNFRNVQYIRCGDMLYWVYCLNMDNLKLFSFIGFNISYPVLNKILSGAGYYMGYIHHISEYTGVRTEVWYNPDKLVLAVFAFDGSNKLVKKNCYLRKFEKEHVIKTGNTGCMFENHAISNVPLMAIGEYDALQSDNSRLWWTGIVNMAENIYDDTEMEDYPWEEDDDLCGYKFAFINPEYLEQEDFEEDSKDERFDPFCYEEMLTIMFNKGSSVR